MPLSLPELICGSGHQIDWEAVASISTAGAVFVALWLPAKDRRERRLAELSAQTSAAGIVSLSLSTVIEIFPRISEHIRKTNGVLIDAPGLNFVYGIDGCQEIIEREIFIHRLPPEHLELGILVSTMARKWCSEINTRLQIQRNEELRNKIDWQNHEHTCDLADRLHTMALQLRERCTQTKSQLEVARKPLLTRAVISITKRIKQLRKAEK